MPRKFTRRVGVEQLESRCLLSTYFVATTGSDSNNGSQGSPFRTMQHAMMSLHPGDILNVEQGSYPGWISGWDSQPASGGDPYGTIDGTAGSPITIQADPSAPAGSVIINSRNSKTPSGIDLEPNCNYITIQNFTITNGDGTISHYGIKVAQSNFVNILNNTAYGVGLTGIFTAFASDGIIANNLCYNNGEHGIYASNSPQNEQVLNNISHDNANGGIQVNADGTQGGPGTAQNIVVADNIIYNNGATGGGALNFDGLQNSLVENNLLYNNHSSGIVLYKYNASGGSINDIIVNNTVVQAPGARPALNNNNTSSGNFFYNDIFLGDMLVDSTSTPAAFSNNVLLTGYTNKGSYQFPPSIMSTAAALFADASGGFTQPGDYQLLASSPAIGAGTSTDAPSTDIVGNARPTATGYDIGAYQYQPGVPGFRLVPAASVVTAGSALGITVTATIGGAVNTNYRGTVHFTSSDTQAGLPGDYTFTSTDQGVHTFTVTLKTAGSQTVTVTDTSNSSDTTTTSITVNPGATSTLAVSGFPSSTTAGISHSFTVTAKDAYGNLTTGYTGTVHFTSSDGHAVLPGDYTFVGADNGSHTFSATLNTAGSQSITATDRGNSGISGSESNITVNVNSNLAGTLQLGAANYLVSESGGSITITVNRTNGSSGPVSVQYATSPGTDTAGLNYQAASGTLNFADGQTSATFTITVMDDHVVEGNETVNLTLTNAGGGASIGGQGNAVLTIKDVDGTPNQRYVAQLYLDLFLRQVDSSGLGTWTNFLNNGGSRTQLVQALEGSREYRTVVVQRIYQRFLHRQADPAGLATFVAMLGSGGMIEDVKAQVVGSSEYFQDGGGTNQGFLDALYQDAFGRAPDPSGLSMWENALATGTTRQQVAADIFASREYLQDLVGAYYWLYLHRQADTTGLNTFVTALQRGTTDQDVIASIVSSGEYYSQIQ